METRYSACINIYLLKFLLPFYFKQITVNYECRGQGKTDQMRPCFSSDPFSGRNVALKQSAAQSSRLLPATNAWLAWYAVDGTTGGNNSLTCTHTAPDRPTPGWWTVTFSQAACITIFLIYNRNGKSIESIQSRHQKK